MPTQFMSWYPSTVLMTFLKGAVVRWVTFLSALNSKPNGVLAGNLKIKAIKSSNQKFWVGVEYRE